MTYTGVVLAGSRPGRDAFAEQFGSDLKALIPVSGKPMIQRPIEALLGSEKVGQVMILAQDPERIAAALPEDPRLSVCSSQRTIAETMLALCNDPGIEWPLLVTTADHALLDTATVDEFISSAGKADIAIGVVERAVLMRRLPLARRTWLRFKGSAYTGANLFALRSPKVAPAIQLWRSAEQDRKKGWRLIALFGPSILMGAVLRIFTLDDVLLRVGRKIGLIVKSVRLSNPLAGVDVDKAEDHALAESILKDPA